MKRILFSLALAVGLSAVGTEAQACHRGYVYYAPVSYCGPVYHAPVFQAPMVTNFAPVVQPNQVFFNDCVQPMQWAQPMNVCYPNTVWYGGYTTVGHHGHCGWGHGGVIWR